MCKSEYQPVHWTPAISSILHSASPSGRAGQSKRADSNPAQLNWSIRIGPEPEPKRTVASRYAMEFPAKSGKILYIVRTDSHMVSNQLCVCPYCCMAHVQHVSNSPYFWCLCMPCTVEGQSINLWPACMLCTGHVHTWQLSTMLATVGSSSSSHCLPWNPIQYVHSRIPSWENPSWLQTTSASKVPKRSVQTPPHPLFIQTSTKPRVSLAPPTSLKLPSVQSPFRVEEAALIGPGLWTEPKNYQKGRNENLFAMLGYKLLTLTSNSCLGFTTTCCRRWQDWAAEQATFITIADNRWDKWHECAPSKCRAINSNSTYTLGV